MTLRQTLNRHPFIAASLAVLILVVLTLRWTRNPPPGQLAFYTTDDGATLFGDDLRKVPPFDCDGKPAVRAFVFTCDNGQHRFVLYLQKYSNQVKQQLGATTARFPLDPGLIKRPGDDNKWIGATDPKASRIVTSKCPEGSGAGPIRQVWP